MYLLWLFYGVIAYLISHLTWILRFKRKLGDKSKALIILLLVTGETNRGLCRLGTHDSTTSNLSFHVSYRWKLNSPWIQLNYKTLQTIGFGWWSWSIRKPIRRKTYLEASFTRNKSNFSITRLGAPDRLGKRGIHKIGLGRFALVWRTGAQTLWWWRIIYGSLQKPIGEAL